MSNSTHDVVVVKLGPPEVHPNADRLEIHRIFDAYRCVSQKGLYKEGDLVAYIPPDNVVPDTEDFAWLEGKRRIKAKKLRGVISYGLLHPAPLGSVEGYGSHGNFTLRTRGSLYDESWTGSPSTSRFLS